MALPRSTPLTFEDMEAMPDDGRRYELIHGSLLVTPAPTGPHQVAGAALLSVLRAARPAGLSVLLAPIDLRRPPGIWLQPDLVVVTVDQAMQAFLTVPPLLVVEILSESTRAQDLGSKRLTYAELGIPGYWVVDLEEPSVLLLTLDAGAYREVARPVGSETITVERPFPVSFTPAELLIP